MKTSPSKTLATALIFLSLAAGEQKVQAVVPPPDGGYPNFTTAEGTNALQNLTTGAANTGIGWYALFSAGAANYNTGVGAGALALNTENSNTAVGTAALILNITGFDNTAVGTAALSNNDDGFGNTATGSFALNGNTHGTRNTANGFQALQQNATGGFNTADGDLALFNNIDGSTNTAVGSSALQSNTVGNDNTAVGVNALPANMSGGFNTALGSGAGFNATMGDGNVYLGAGMQGVAGEANHTYIRNINTTSVNGGGTDSVTVDLMTGLVGHASSSRRYKDDIKPMDTASQSLFRLKPVSFRYQEIDQRQSLDYGLIAEEVAEVDPNLASRDRNGQVENVRYSAINAMLLNEFLKEHHAFLEEQKKVRKLEAALAAVNERLKEQETKIERVSAQVNTSRRAPQVVQIP